MQDEAEEEEEEDEEEEEEKEEEAATNIKSNNPHLAGGELKKLCTLHVKLLPSLLKNCLGHKTLLRQCLH